MEPIHSSPTTLPLVSAHLLACSQLDQTSKWALVFLCRGESTCESFSYSLRNFHTFSLTIPPLSSLPLSLHLLGLLQPFGVWVKEEEQEFSFPNRKLSCLSKYLYRDQQWWTQDYGRSADTALKRCVLSLPAVVFKLKTLEPRGGAPQSKPQEKTAPPWYPDCAIYYIWRMFNQHSWLFS